ncbi:MAG: hypothetical protein J5965_04265 [Aeriscardovia sp.]|nr:hypothetical protein [Aeriscardovia sp.]
MAGFSESGIDLDFTSGTWFRFQESEPYSSVSGFGFKEMDACYLEIRQDGSKVFYAIELKDFTEAESLTEDTMSKRIWNIVKKNVDTLQMFLSARYQHSFGKALEREKNIDLHTDLSKVFFLTIVNVKPENAQMVQTLKDKCLGKLCAYSKVWDSISFTLMTKEQAQNRYTFVK